MGKEKCQAKKICGLGMAALAGAIAGGALVKKLWLEKYRKQKAELGAVFQEREILYSSRHGT